ncbi:MAG: hypothetical protein HZA01_08075 [Nitrospinae bacterium]|nr:hypothetical protein [Nitrospinota bacterium]
MAEINESREEREGNFGLGISDFKSAIRDPQSKIQNPKPKIHIFTLAALRLDQFFY